MLADNSKRVEEFLKRIVQELTPAVVDAVQRDSNGHFEIHYTKGSYGLTYRRDKL